MVDKKDSFDDEFDFDDDFPSFDDDTDDETESYHFDDESDDEEDGAFDFSDSSNDEEEDHEDAPVSLNDDTYEFEDIDGADDVDDAPFKKENFLEQIIARLKKEEPKKLAIYGGAAFFILVMAVFFIMKQFSSSTTAPVRQVSTTHKTPAFKSSKFENNNMNVAQTNSENTLPDMSDNMQNASNNTLPAPVSTQQSVDLPMPGQQTTQVDEQTHKTITSLVAQNKELNQTVHDMQMALTRAGEKYNNLAQQIQSSDARITNIERSIAQVESQMSKVDNALQAIVSAATATNQPASMEGYYGPSTSSRGDGVRTTYQAPKHSSQANVYYIQAIIPGRAWIRTSNGQTITVAYGDEIAGLGKVTKIDAENGLVMTSSGAKVMYGINEG